jgi:hypothetical protein
MTVEQLQLVGEIVLIVIIGLALAIIAGSWRR